jgi:hypothetical protein
MYAPMHVRLCTCTYAPILLRRFFQPMRLCTCTYAHEPMPMNLYTFGAVLVVGRDLGGGNYIANAFPAAKLPCRILSVLDCFQVHA